MSRSLVFFLLTGLLGGLPTGVLAQGVLDQYLQLGLESNLSLRQKNLAVDKSRAALREAKGLFYPQVSFLASYSLAGGGRTLDFPIGDLLNPIYGTLNQLTGTEQFPTNLENVNEQFAPNNFQETKFRLVQPLFNTDIYYNQRIKSQLVQLEASSLEVYRRELVRDIRTAYLGFLQSEAVLAIYQETEGLLQEIRRVNQRLVENDKATLDAVYRAEHELSKLAQQLAQAQQQNHAARAYVNFLLNRPLETPLEIDSTLVPTASLFQLEELQADALRQRAELEQLNFVQAANLEALNLEKGRLLPQVNAVLDIGYQGFGYNFGEEQDYWLAAASLNWNLFQGFQRQARQQQVNIEQDRLQLQREEVSQQIQLQVQQAYYQVQAAQSAVIAAQSGLRSARQAFHLTQKKYQENQASLLELLDTRTQFTTAQISLTIARYHWLSQLAELEFATGG